MILRLAIFFVFGCLFPLEAGAQQVETIIKTGNDLYRQEKYDQAELQYRKAIEIDPANKEARFNLANVLYKEGKQEEAKTFYDDINNKETEPGVRSKSFYNKGVVLSAQKKLEESIEAYKNALRINPDDKEARENLQKALLELKKKQPPKKKDEKKKDQKQQKQQQQQPQSKMSQKEAEQKLKLLEQKEKEVLQRLQKEKAKGGSGLPKDW